MMVFLETNFGRTTLESPTLYDGSDCTGSSGAYSRVLTHSRNIARGHIITVSGRTLMFGDDYTISGAEITFSGIMVDDSDRIMVIA